jgi:hypothetical protein
MAVEPASAFDGFASFAAAASCCCTVVRHCNDLGVRMEPSFGLKGAPRWCGTALFDIIDSMPAAVCARGWLQL